MHSLYRTWCAVEPDADGKEVKGRGIALYWGYNPELAYEPYEEEVTVSDKGPERTVVSRRARARSSAEEGRPLLLGRFAESFCETKVPGTDVG